MELPVRRRSQGEGKKALRWGGRWTGEIEREVLLRGTMTYAAALFSFGREDRGRLVEVRGEEDRKSGA
jgi:hypothetical protein